MRQLRGVEIRRFKRKLPKPQLEIALILDDIQYARNVAEIFRIADAAKVKSVYLSGISAQPPFGKELQKVSRQKEKSVVWKYQQTVGTAIRELKRKGYKIIALEMTDDAQDYREFAKYNTDTKIAILLGNEGHGIPAKTLSKADKAVYLPMFGKGASLNVAVATAIIIYTLI